MRFSDSILLTLLFVILSGISACKKNDRSEPLEQELDFKTMKVPDNFSYETTEIQPINVEVLLLGKIPYEGARFDIYLDDPTSVFDDLEALKSLRMLSGFKLNSKGIYSSEIRLPTYISTIYLLSKSVGIPQVFRLDKSSTGFSLKYDASEPFKPAGVGVFNSHNKLLGSSGFSTLGTARSWSNVGFPNYLIDPITLSSSFLRRFQAMVPPLSPINPNYLNKGNNTITLDLLPGQTADVTITFMFANSSNKNTIGYYWYDTSTPPSNPAAITNKGYIFPSTSNSLVANSSGLVAGHTVALVGPNADGSFPPNTSIGFFLISGGFSPNNTVGVPGTILTNRTTYYTNDSFNNIGTAGNMAGIQQRMVTFYDEDTNKIIWTFEDGTDANFSDIAFFASWNPNQAIDVSSYTKLLPVAKTDADYIFYPAKDVMGTLMFEDCWPKLGDFDMNDMVLNHNYIGELDAFGKIKQINFTYELASISAEQNNSFAVMIPDVAPDNVSSVSNLDLNGINLNSLATRNYSLESGHNNDVVIEVFRDANTIMGGKTVNNIGTGSITRASERFSFTVKFNPSIDLSKFNNISPFIIPRGDRNVETHLPNRRPTIKARISMFGSEDDNSSLGLQKYYLSNTRNSLGNLNWVVDVPMKIPYSKSGRSVINAYKNFAAWATSGGVNKTNWYTNGTGNRNDSFLVTP